MQEKSDIKGKKERKEKKERKSLRVRKDSGVKVIGEMLFMKSRGRAGKGEMLFVKGKVKGCSQRAIREGRAVAFREKQGKMFLRGQGEMY